MNYEEKEMPSTQGTQKHIIIDLGDGAFKSFPADPENPEYAAFLKSLETPSTPANSDYQAYLASLETTPE